MDGEQTGEDAGAKMTDMQRELVAERYRYILGQIRSMNENSMKFLSLFQALTTGIVTAGLALFVGHSTWGVSPDDAKVALIGLLVLEGIVAVGVIFCIVSGLISWFHYRCEESDLLDMYVSSDFKPRPTFKYAYRWFETYYILLVLAVTAFLWVLTFVLIIPAIS